MDTVIKLAGVCLVAVLFAVLIKKYAPEMSLLVVLGTCVAVLAVLAQITEKISEFLQEIYTWGDLPQEIFVPLLKTLGIALISRTGAELCRDAEQKAVAVLLETAGTFASVLVAIPLFEQVWDMLKKLL